MVFVKPSVEVGRDFIFLFATVAQEDMVRLARSQSNVLVAGANLVARHGSAHVHE
jgi:hypothetical protein